MRGLLLHSVTHKCTTAYLRLGDLGCQALLCCGGRFICLLPMLRTGFLQRLRSRNQAPGAVIWCRALSQLAMSLGMA